MFGQYETWRDALPRTDCWLLPNNTCEPHFHSSIEVTYLLEGRLQGLINGTPYAMEPGDVLVCPSYSIHQFTTLGDSTSIVMTVPLDFIPSVKLGLQSMGFAAIHASLPSDNPVKQTMLALVDACKTRTVGDVTLKGYTYTVMGHLMDILGMKPIARGGQTDFARDVLLYLDDHYQEALVVDQVAAAFGYSRSHFMHLFSDCFGLGFWEYLNVLRCRNAAMVMTNERLPLADAALRSGFNCLRTFYRNFKQVFGVTPTTYMRARRTGRR